MKKLILKLFYKKELQNLITEFYYEVEREVHPQDANGRVKHYLKRRFKDNQF